MIDNLIAAGKNLVQKLGFSQLVLGVSGGVDSSFALYLATQILPKEQIFVYLMPVGAQSIAGAEKIVDFCEIPPANTVVSNLEECLAAEIRRISAFDTTIDLAATHLYQDYLRRGNLIARLRMLTLFDQAATKKALVLGTKNLSEKLLGYSTLYGDSASSIEFFDHLYKTQVVQLASLVIPIELARQTPSAELWPAQTDEQELGFGYAEADRILAAHHTPHLTEQQKTTLLADLEPVLIEKVLDRAKKYQFKQEVPYSAADFGATWDTAQLGF